MFDLIKLIVGFFIFIFFLVGNIMPVHSSEIKTWIEMREVDQKLVVMPQVKASGDMQLRYELISIKGGKSGKSSTNQSGKISVLANQISKLSTLVLGVGETDGAQFTLKVYHENNLIGEDSLIFPVQY